MRDGISLILPRIYYSDGWKANWYCFLFSFGCEEGENDDRKNA